MSSCPGFICARGDGTSAASFLVNSCCGGRAASSGRAISSGVRSGCPAPAASSAAI
jgi:hypothetical protein